MLASRLRGMSALYLALHCAQALSQDAPATAQAPLTVATDSAPGTPQPPTPVLSVPGAARPVQGPFDAPAGPPSYQPALPAGTPADQVQRDPAATVTAFTEALQRAYWTNPKLLSDRARTRSVDYGVPQARGQYGPQLQYSASYGYQHDAFEQPTGDVIRRSQWTSTAEAVLTQPLFTFGRLRANEDVAKAAVAFQRAALRASEEETLLNAIGVYVSVLRDRAAVAIAADNAELLARELSDTRTRLRLRESTSTDLGQVEARAELARAQLVAAQGAAASSDALFLRVIGAPAGDLAAPNPLVIPSGTIEDAYALAAAQNPVVASAYARERSSRAKLEFAKADLLPRVDLQGQATVGTISPYGNGLRQTELRGSVVLSGVLDSGILKARIDEARAANDADWRLIDDAIRENRSEVADAWNTWQAQSASVERYQSSTDAARRALEGGLLQERAGLRTTSEVLELARDLLQVRSSLNSAMAAAYIQQARLLAALGALEQANLLQGAERYDPDIHYRETVHKADVPLLTSIVRSVDSLTTPPHSDRPVRDPAASLETVPSHLSHPSH